MEQPSYQAADNQNVQDEVAFLLQWNDDAIGRSGNQAPADAGGRRSAGKLPLAPGPAPDEAARYRTCCIGAALDGY
ncbi:hypothetical protein [Marinimicrococcus flavescens]|uniref:Uncharacterized protein n=1 Tax=Marinimicrococcus flavescens TaxID=3031815 RepID=A0AAP3UXU8_9PROT|nr:hypothetical protein [Marinimicrococcus flavescens]